MSKLYVFVETMTINSLYVRSRGRMINNWMFVEGGFTTGKTHPNLLPPLDKNKHREEEEKAVVSGM